MIEKIITDNSNETIKIKWDGERFALTHSFKTDYGIPILKTIILNPREMMTLVEFAGKLGVNDG